MTVATLLRTARGDVEVATMGSGPALLFAHGMPGTWQQALSLAGDLAGSHTVVLVSRPGYGRTPLTSGRTAAEQADLYAALLDALGIDDVTVAGISGGGPSALAFAQRHPDRTRHLALLCALASHLIRVPRYAAIGVRVPIAFRVGAAVELRRDRRSLRDPAAFDRLIRSMLTPAEAARFDDDPRLRADYEAFFRSRVDAPSWHVGMRNDVGQLVANRAPAPVDRITAPATIVHGDCDPVVPLVHAEYHASVLPASSLHVIAGAGHGVPISQRDRTVEILQTAA